MKSAVEAAVDGVREAFPFPGYLEASPHAHAEIGATVCRWLPRGARVLDFGAGPLDKTAVLQRLGYRCTAYDDLGDPWHNVADNRARILAFADAEGIDYRLVPQPLPEGPFDMVMLHDVLEHLHDSPRSLLLELLGLVAPQGYLFMTIPNAGNVRKRIALLAGRSNLPDFDSFYWSGNPWRGHVREYVRGDLEQLTKLLDLRVVDLRGVHHLADRLPVAVRLPYLAFTSIFRGMRDSWLLVAQKSDEWHPSREPDAEVAARIRAAESPYWNTAETG